MANIPESYASPGIRIGLLLEDHPEAEITYHESTASEMGVPDSWGGDQMVVVCTIMRPGLPDVVGWKPVELRVKRDRKWVDATLDPDWWNVQCTKALGRALKRCGYPDDMRDLKALVHWRQRNAEIDAIGTGVEPLAAIAAESVDPMEAAARARPDEEHPDPDDELTEVLDAEVIDPHKLLSERLADVDEGTRVAYLKWRRSVADEGADLSDDDCWLALDFLDEAGA